MLSGPLISSLSPARPVPAALETRMTYESPVWQARAWQEVNRCHQLLLAESGALGQAYLQKRGLNRTTWQAASLGLGVRMDSEARKGWAISIPWWDHQGRVTAINYRFIEPRAQRYIRFGYGKDYGETVLFSTPTDAAQGSSTLVVTEGELNAVCP